jgi:hypothetical protein
MALRMWECTLVYKNTSTAEVAIKVWKSESVYSIYVTGVLCAAGLLDPTWAWAPTGSSSICPQSDQNRFYNRENQRPGCHSGCEIFTVSLNDRTVKVVQLVNKDRILYGQETSCLPDFCLSRTNICQPGTEDAGLPRTWHSVSQEQETLCVAWNRWRLVCQWQHSVSQDQETLCVAWNIRPVVVPRSRCCRPVVGVFCQLGEECLLSDHVWHASGLSRTKILSVRNREHSVWSGKVYVWSPRRQG